MRPQTIRRLLVFAVCCAGVAALYFVPGTAESPDQVTSAPGTQPEPPPRTVTQKPEPAPTPEPSPTATPTQPTATTTVTATPSPTASRSNSPDPTSSTTSAPEDEESDPPSPDPTPTATDDPEEPEPDPTDEPESEPPGQVEGVQKVETKTTHEELTVSWTAPADDEDIKKYVIYLNDTPVTAQHPTSPTEGTVSWFNGEQGFFVQVAAVDTDDQEGEKSERVTVERPEDPSPSPEPPPESESPNFTPSPTAEPTS